MSYSEKSIEIMLRKAKDNFLTAQDSYNNGRYDICISSLYYSAFQTITALLIARGELFNKHTKVRAFVNRELAGSGVLDRSLSRSYSQLMDLRMAADYSSDTIIDQSTALRYIGTVEQFNEAVELLIDK